MESVVLVIHVLLSVAVIGLVLIQHGKGADAGAAFGSGASGTVFGARGSGSLLTRITTLMVILFFGTSLVLFYLAAQRPAELGSVTDALPAATETVQEEATEIPVDPAPAANQAEDVPAID